MSEQDGAENITGDESYREKSDSHLGIDATNIEIQPNIENQDNSGLEQDQESTAKKNNIDTTDKKLALAGSATNPERTSFSDDAIKMHMDALLERVGGSDSGAVNKNNPDNPVKTSSDDAAGERQEVPVLSEEQVARDAVRRSRAGNKAISREASESARLAAIEAQQASTAKLRTSMASNSVKKPLVNMRIFDKYALVLVPMLVVGALILMLNYVITFTQSQDKMKAASSHLQSGDAASALALFDEASSIYPSNRDSFLMAGKAAEALADYRKASERYSRVLEKWPGDPVALEGLGRSASKLERFDIAAESYTALFKLDSGKPSKANLHNRAYANVRLGKWNEALLDYAVLLRREPGDDDALVGIALCQAKLGRFQQASEKLGEVLERNPLHERALLLRGECYLHEGEHAKAKADYESVLARNPDSLLGLLHMASLMVAQNKDDAAKINLDLAVKKHPRSLEALKQRAEFYLSKKNYEAAFADSKTCHEIDEKQENLYSRVMTVETDLKQRRFSQALGDLESIIKDYPDWSRLLVLRSRAHAGLGNYEAAIADCKTALDKEPRNRDAALYLARHNNAAGNSLTAMKDYANAIAIAPKNIIAYLELASLEQQMSRPKEALEHYQKALSLDKNNKDAQNGVASARNAIRPGSTSSVVDVDRVSAKDKEQISKASFEELLKLVHDALQARKLDYAVAGSLRLVQMNPNHVVARQYLFLSLIAQKRPELAEPHLMALFKLGSATEADFIKLANLFAKNGNPMKAITVLQTYIAAHPDSIASIEQISMIYLESGRLEDAIEFLEKNAAEAGSTPRAQKLRASIEKLKTRQKQLEREQEENLRREEQEQQQNFNSEPPPV